MWAVMRVLSLLSVIAGQSFSPLVAGSAHMHENRHFTWVEQQLCLLEIGRSSLQSTPSDLSPDFTTDPWAHLLPC